MTPFKLDGAGLDRAGRAGLCRGLSGLRWLSGMTVFVVACASAEPSSPTNRLRLDWVVATVLSNNPSLRAARAGVESRLERVRQERAWMDPRVGVDFERMGTTCSTLILSPEGALLGHVGDSRVYRIRG